MTAPDPGPHRIAVRVDEAGRGAFHDTVTGLEVRPRGVNYVRWADGQHATFDTGEPPDRYDPERTERELAEIAIAGYDCVRVFVNQRQVGAVDGSRALDPRYLANLADFTRRAGAYRLHVLPVANYLPVRAWGVPGVWDPPPRPEFERFNAFALSADFVEAAADYLRLLVAGLAEAGAPLASFLGWLLSNEHAYLKDRAPLSLTEGLVRTADGRTYDMAVPGQKAQMCDANLVHWIDTLRTAVRDVDPDALVGPGFFAPRFLRENPTDVRRVRTHWAIADPERGGSTADFVDVHCYPHFGPRSLGSAARLQAQVDSLEVSSRRKPLLMGEFGALRTAYPTAAQAGSVLRAWQRASCRTRRGDFSGWVAWQWDSEESNDLRAYWNLSEARGAVNAAVAPVARPDPCG